MRKPLSAAVIELGSHANSNKCRRDVLAYPVPMRPDTGLTVEKYFEAKHRKGRFGNFWPLHETAFQPRRGR